MAESKSKTPVGHIIETCLRLDRFSLAMYENFGKKFKGQKVCSEWERLATEERSHVEFWEKLFELSQQGDVPELFDNPGEIRIDLQSIIAKGKALNVRFHEKPTVQNAFLFACRMEFYLIHPALSTLFVYANCFSKEFILADTYDAHIDHFIASFRNHSADSLELDLMGESMEKLWKQNRSLARLGALDELTGVLNRRGFFHAVKPLANMSQRLKEEAGLLIADMDDFKKINDTYGHVKGDEVLRALGSVLRKSVRASDVVGRYGGEEFIIFFPGIKRQYLLQIAEKIRETLIEETRNIVPSTISIGVAGGFLSEDAMNDILTMTKLADDNLYQAKKQGKNRVV